MTIMSWPSSQMYDPGVIPSSQRPLAATTNPQRKRRSRREIDRLILDAALTLFASKGFSGTTMREIADRAGVYEPMVYRRFHCKEDLFQAAVLVPFDQVVATFLRVEQAPEARDPGLLRSLLEELYRLFADHRELGIALVAGCGTSDTGREPNSAIVGHELEQLVETLVPFAQAQLPASGERDPASVVAVTMGLALGVALLEPFFTTSRGGLSRDGLLDEMKRLRFAPDRAGAADGSDQTSGSSDVAGQLLREIAGARRRAGQAKAELKELRGSGRNETGA
jgi:AcrR family transcriptional regulator